MKKKTTNKKNAPNKEAAKNRQKPALMCKSYKQFGFALLGIGAAFFLMNFIFGENNLRIAIVAFFIMLGVVDLLLYMRYGEG